jgi:V8-like Glu-specific endopeptidase
MILSLRGRALAGSVALCALATAALSQTNPVPSNKVKIPIDTGYAFNDGTSTSTVIAFHVYEPGAQWLRLYFSDIELGTGAFLRITSLKDGYYQTLDAVSAVQWEKSSAYFNGDTLLVEVVAQPGTGGNRVVLDSADVGLVPSGDTICGTTDDRVLSNDPRAARILPIGCTGWIIDDACGCMITAGHCTSGTSVIQFNVPLSNANGSLNNPPPQDQYMADSASKQFQNAGIGNDWGYFGCFANSTTGLTPRQKQGQAFTFASPPAWNSGLEVRITGYGVDTGTANQVQQTHKGPWVSYTAGNTTLQYQADTQGGNSGSPVIQEQSGVAMGVHTHGGCTSGGGANSGTASVHPSWQNAIANPKGVCFKAVCPVGGVTTRNMAPNLNVYTATAPVIGQTSTFTVNTSGFQFVRIIGVAVSGMRQLDNGYWALINADSTILLSVGPLAGPNAMASQVVTNDPSLCGITIYSQGKLFDVAGGAFALTNSQDLRIGS